MSKKLGTYDDGKLKIDIYENAKDCKVWFDRKELTKIRRIEIVMETNHLTIVNIEWLGLHD